MATILNREVLENANQEVKIIEKYTQISDFADYKPRKLTIFL